VVRIRWARGLPEVGSTWEQRGCGRRLRAPLRAAVLLEVLVVWSFVYLALRRLGELILLCWHSADAKKLRSWFSATNWQFCAASTHSLGSSPKTAPC
jgi:hypothetical protein